MVVCKIFGVLESYTFLETLGPTEYEKQCLHFFQAPNGGHFGFSRLPPVRRQIALKQYWWKIHKI